MDSNQPINNTEKTPDNQRIWAMCCHLSTLIMLIGVPFGNIWVPLIIWLLKRKDMPVVEEAGRESINFQISMTLYLIVSTILFFPFINFLLVPPLLLINVILVINASIKVSNDEQYRYPFTIRFIK